LCQKSVCFRQQMRQAGLEPPHHRPPSPAPFRPPGNPPPILLDRNAGDERAPAGPLASDPSSALPILIPVVTATPSLTEEGSGLPKLPCRQRGRAGRLRGARAGNAGERLSVRKSTWGPEPMFRDLCNLMRGMRPPHGLQRSQSRSPKSGTRSDPLTAA